MSDRTPVAVAERLAGRLEGSLEVVVTTPLLRRLVGQSCRGVVRRPDPFESADATDCSTWATEADIQRVVPDRDGASFGQVDVVHDGRACHARVGSGSAGRDYSEDEPFFAWLLTFHASLVVRGQEISDENWDAYVTTDISRFDCDRPPLPSDLEVCSRAPSDGLVDAVVDLGDRVVEVVVGVTSTNGHPDLPAGGRGR